jgi:hypothetical protein
MLDHWSRKCIDAMLSHSAYRFDDPLASCKGCVDFNGADEYVIVPPCCRG